MAASTPEQQSNANAGMKKFLGDFGLSALEQRLWDYIVTNGVDDENRLLLWVYEQPEFKARFPAIETLSKKGRAISPAQYIALERGYKQVMQEFGIPAELYDTNEDFKALIENEVSPNELQGRVQDGYAKVANADPKVRQAFQRFFGPASDAALAAFFIDPNRALPKLEAAVASAEVSGVANRMGFNVGLNEADRLARMGVTYDKALEGFQRMNANRDLFEQGMGDTKVAVEDAEPNRFGVTDAQGGTPTNTTPFTGTAAGDAGSTDPGAAEGMAYVFGTDGDAQRELQMRLGQRRAAVAAETQNDTITRSGKGSLGAAE